MWQIWFVCQIFFMLIFAFDYKNQTLEPCTLLKDLNMKSKLNHFSHGGLEIYFDLCDSIPQEHCGSDIKMCVKKGGKLFITGSTFNLVHSNQTSNNYGNNNVSFYLSNLTAHYCTNKTPEVVVKFVCADDTKEEATVKVKNECEFEIHMHHDCKPKCTTRVLDNFIDLRPLAGVYETFSELGNFSIGFCKTNENCDPPEQFSSCLFNANKTPVLLAGTTEDIHYNVESNLILIRNKIKGKGKPGIEINVKCDWRKDKPVLNFLKMPTQGRKYHFEMLTKHVCMKLYHSSEIRANPYNYNLKSLWTSSDSFRIAGKRNEVVFLNISGPLTIKESDNKCVPWSQVCCKNGSDYINWGSLSTEPSLNSGIITLRFTNGDRCNNSREQGQPFRQTVIDLICDYHVKELQYDYHDNCTMYLKLKTFQACPKYDKSSCTLEQTQNQRCIKDFDDRFYDFTSLNQKQNTYTIEDQNETIEYLLNICGPVFNDEIPCFDNSSVFMKDKSEVDIRKRFISLGKISEVLFTDKHFIVKTSSGRYCDPHDYQSNIYLECSDFEESPRILNKTKCSVNFLWRTHAACPVFKEKVNDATMAKCIFTDKAKSQEVDLKSVKKDTYYVRVNETGTLYIFDLCNQSSAQCNPTDNCIHIKAERNLIKRDNKMFLEFLLNRSCRSSHDFNKTLVELVCDPLMNNDHYELFKIEGCTMTYKLFTHLVCQDENLYSYTESKANVLPDNCSLTNPQTGKTFYLTNSSTVIHLFNQEVISANNGFPQFFVHECPKYTFNPDKNFTQLEYKTDKYCNKEKDQERYFTFFVKLLCSDRHYRNITKLKCSEVHFYENPENCGFLQNHLSQGSSSNWLAIIGITSLMVAVILVIVVFGIKYWKMTHTDRSISYCRAYQKDGDL